MQGAIASPRKTLSRTKIIIFSILPIMLLLLVGELGLRVWAHYFRTSYERFNYKTGRLELVPNIHFTHQNGAEFFINSKGFVGPEFAAPKPPGAYRIFALGDSCTFGTGYWQESYPYMLERLLNAAGRQQKFEVINAGIEGYNSDYALARLKDEVLRYEPDMVTLYIGWNDLMKVNPNNLSATGRYTWLAGLMDRSYLMRGYSKILFYYIRPAILQPAVAQSAAEKHVFDSFQPLFFLNNLEQIISILKEKNTRIVLVTLPTVVRHGMSNHEIKSKNVFFPYYAGTYSVDKFLSLHSSYNKAIISTAQKHHVAFVDLDTLFNKKNKDELFWDTMHLSMQGHGLVAQWMAPTVLENM
jgi:lysophospholipase L1-like esterase